MHTIVHKIVAVYIWLLSSSFIMPIMQQTYIHNYTYNNTHILTDKK